MLQSVHFAVIRPVMGAYLVMVIYTIAELTLEET